MHNASPAISGKSLNSVISPSALIDRARTTTVIGDFREAALYFAARLDTFSPSLPSIRPPLLPSPRGHSLSRPRARRTGEIFVSAVIDSVAASRWNSDGRPILKAGLTIIIIIIKRKREGKKHGEESMAR